MTDKDRRLCRRFSVPYRMRISTAGGYRSSIIDNGQKAKYRIKVVAKLILWCQHLIKIHSLRSSKHDVLSPYVISLSFHGDKQDGDQHDGTSRPVFDYRYYKADRQLRVSDAVRTILCQDTEQRSKEQIQYCQIGLYNIKSFSEYPLKMQYSIAGCGRYERYEAKRIIIRQGQIATAFYLILSGSVVVIVADADTAVPQPVAYLHRGMSFGDLAIVNSTKRQSTIIAKETVELLSMDIADFRRTFMAGGAKSLLESENMRFIRRLPMFREWPMNVLENNKDKYMCHYYRNREVVVRDSNCSAWIYIIKSGSLMVLKRLKQTHAKVQRKSSDVFRSESRDGQCEEDRSFLKDLLKTQRKRRNKVANSDETRLSLPSVIRSHNSMSSTSSDEMSTPRRRRKKRDREKDRLKEEQEEMRGRIQNIRTVAGDLDNQRSTQTNTEADNQPSQFVRLQNLTAGDVFGLVDVLYDEQPSVSAVSTGCECIMIDRQLYMKHLNERAKDQLMQMYSQLPDEPTMQSSLQTMSDWMAYKDRYITNTHRIAVLKKQLVFWPHNK